ncbi:hypothetical protein [Paraburkholderia bryophila]|uniref:Uncharacterized protein n=1 Tax=Paraburkholderia bryophila TaxID=420952 RepID=A0A7Y9WIX2_9BURK|nr:hypothetical protein [Paraburkholderia bryophila]NYH21031.1 hypothetical protein [Paraburkholderia bryophila]
MNSLRAHLGDHLFILRATAEQVRRLDDLIGSQDRVLRALQAAVVNAVRDAARSKPHMNEAVALFEGTLSMGGALRLNLASALTRELITKLDCAAGALVAVLDGNISEADRDAVMLCCAEIAGSVESAVVSARSHLAKTRLIVELADDEVEHFRHALIRLQSPSRGCGERTAARARF